MNYGGRDEILRGIQKLYASGDLNHKESLTEEDLGKYLDFAALPNVDLVIRTKGNMARRTSGFMARWIGYAELYFTDVTFPAFDEKEFDTALAWFDAVAEERNFGK